MKEFSNSHNTNFLINTYLNKFLRYIQYERNLSINTSLAYKYDLLQFFEFLSLKNINSLSNISQFGLRNYLSYLKENNLSKRTLARKIATLRTFFKFLTKEGVVKINPTIHLSSPKLDKRLPMFLDRKEIEEMFMVQKNNKFGIRDRAILELLYATGMRVTELINLNIFDVDIDSDELKVSGKGGKERIVIVGKYAREALKEYVKDARPKLLRKNNYYEQALFLNKNGTRLTPRSIQRIVKYYTKIVSINKKITPHTLRHTFATHMLEGGADLRTVQELLGHVNLTTTQIYTHLTQRTLKKTYDKLHPRA